MKVNEISYFETRYFKQSLIEVIDEQLVLDQEIHLETIKLLNFLMIEHAQKNQVNYTDEAVLTSLLFDIIPAEFVMQPDFATEIYTSLLIYYEFLYNEKKLTTEAYLKIVLFFQKNLFAFLKHMARETAKEGSFADFNSQLLTELAELLGEVEPNLPTHERRNNVIQMPTRLRELAPVNKKITDKDYAQLRIELVGFEQPIWRRVIVPVGITYATLHQIIQVLFAWDNQHLHVFELGNDLIGNLEQDQVTLSQDRLFRPSLIQAKTFKYSYDLGQEWLHLITIEEIRTPGKSVTQEIYCLEKVGEAPSEEFFGSDSKKQTSVAEINQRLIKIKI